MTVITQITIAVALVLSIILPFGYYLLGEKSRGRYKTALGVQRIFLLRNHACCHRRNIRRRSFRTGCNRC